ncbi:hypothetical protein AAT19DRAFT_15604 [Rhodotorula toruloides]|uniref:SH3 domain-containing protein n=1 Tax=Rhodotorula toruloides TaxID=5286 RepID=A0A2T0A7R2_RHOTO|nr:hypothetical protein AAT19DRAFT_15604 [Rhodotorula toruloides]
MKYDDGWALGLNLNSGRPPAKGVFPFDCLGEMKRASSLIASRDADLFVALGEVIDKEGQKEEKKEEGQSLI